MPDPHETTGKFTLAMIGGAVVAAPLLGIWPVVGVITVYLGVLGAAKLFRDWR
jgi:hypothetical protein